MVAGSGPAGADAPGPALLGLRPIIRMIARVKPDGAGASPAAEAAAAELEEDGPAAEGGGAEASTLTGRRSVGPNTVHRFVRDILFSSA